MFSTTQIMPQLQQTALAYTATLSGLSIMPGGIAMLRVCGGYVRPMAYDVAHPDASYYFLPFGRVFLMIGLRS
ncbi:hypothetical protein [Mesorhizobium sp. M0778]|uniref:hypothetical protein n=1 Tax=unclassified Mesorhizobium TaxID=325217 RepID=UPI00333AEC1D